MGYSESSIMTAIQSVADLWGIEFVEAVPKNTIWYLTELIDTGLLINELLGLEGSESLFERLRRKERAAFSEARLATFFSKLGYEVELEPASDKGRLNDLAVKYGNDWINFEVKTPQESEIKRDLNRKMSKLLMIPENVITSRDIHIWLACIPSEEYIEDIVSTTYQLACDETQPKQGVINKIAWIRTDYSTTEIIKEDRKWMIPIKTDFLVPQPLAEVYNNTPTLFHKALSFDARSKDKDRIVLLNLTFPFEDDRLLEFIHRKSKQLSPDMPNIVAIDTSNITIKYPRSRQRKINLSKLSPIDKVSRRIGAILLFRNLVYDGKIHLDSVLLEHPEPYKPIPIGFLEDVRLKDYGNVIENTRRRIK